MGKPFRAWPILHAGQHFYVNWQFRQIEQSTVREGGMEKERVRRTRATSWGYLLSSAQLGRIVLGDKLQSNLDNKCFSTAA